ncbi:hypothetical protein [Castellaniella sp.]|uniref:hypothetical protein n=1 Tax=Castellaniella sp. TaxID=1955812 RepID=UPI003C75145E
MPSIKVRYDPMSVFHMNQNIRPQPQAPVHNVRQLTRNTQSICSRISLPPYPLTQAVKHSTIC